MTPIERLRSSIPIIIDRYQVLLESSASPFASVPERWEQCRAEATATLTECFDRVDGRTPATAGGMRLAARIEAQQAAAGIGIGVAESARAAFCLWQAAIPVIGETLRPAPGDQEGWLASLTVADTLGKALMGGLLRGAVGHARVGTAGELPSMPQGPGVVSPLSVREQQVLACVAEALNNREIGRKLGITETTVKRHLRNIFAKLGARSRMCAVRKAGLSLQQLEYASARIGVASRSPSVLHDDRGQVRQEAEVGCTGGHR